MKRKSERDKVILKSTPLVSCVEQEAMPTLNLFTNVPVDAVVASDILRDATKAVAKIIGKPESVKPTSSLFLFLSSFIQLTFFPCCSTPTTYCSMKLLTKINFCFVLFLCHLFTNLMGYC